MRMKPVRRRRWTLVGVLMALALATSGCWKPGAEPEQETNAPAPTPTSAAPEPEPIWHEHEGFWRPVADDGDNRLLLTDGKKLMAWSPEAGELWSTPAPTRMDGSMAVIADAHHVYAQDDGTGVSALSWDSGEIVWEADMAERMNCSNASVLILQSTGQVEGGWLTGLYMGPTPEMEGDCSTGSPAEPVTVAAAIDPKTGELNGEPFKMPGDRIESGHAHSRDGSAIYVFTSDGMGSGLHRYDLREGRTDVLGLNDALGEYANQGVQADLSELDDDTLLLAFTDPLENQRIAGSIDIASWNDDDKVGKATFTAAPPQKDYCLRHIVRTADPAPYCIRDDIVPNPETPDGGADAFWVGVPDEKGVFVLDEFQHVPAPGDLDRRGQAREDSYGAFNALIPADTLEAGSGAPGIVVPGDGASVAAFDVATGDELWRFEPSSGDGVSTQPYALPSLGEVAFVIRGAGDEETVILDAATGAEVERVTGGYNALDGYSGEFLVVNDGENTRVRVLP